LYGAENQAKIPLMYEKLPLRKEELPKRKFFQGPMSYRIKLILPLLGLS
jgi:hypothetical protein